MGAKLTASSGKFRKKRTSLRKIAEEILRGQKFLISTHQNPEGDAVGSVLALGLALEGMGKEVKILLQDPTPDLLKFLPGAEKIIHQAPQNERFDGTFALDCGDRERLGKEFAKVQEIGKFINIDHHISNTHFGEMNFVNPAASSAAEIIFDLLRAIPAALNQAVAENIYVGVLTDTGSFHYSSTTPKTFAVARACLLAGVEPWKMAQRVYETQSLPRLRLLQRVLGTLEVLEQGRVGTILVSRQMLEEAGANPAHAEDFINYPRSLEGVEVAVLFREIGPDQYRVSLRSRESVDVARIAGEFQGGGHAKAAGCTVRGNLGEVRDKVLGLVRTAF
jgi:phosphoesterase RecJ-like protein